jgi:predicted transcriptional regulator
MGIIVNRPRMESEYGHAAIITLVQARPELSYKAIGAQFGVTGASVSQIIAGKRGKRRQARLDRLLKDNPPDAEFGAIRVIIAALEPLEKPARERVTRRTGVHSNTQGCDAHRSCGNRLPQDPGQTDGRSRRIAAK